MRRGYDREGYLRKIDGLRRRMPEIALGTDVIVGFPTETPGDFEDTLRLLDEVEFDTVYSFTYSERPGTAALALGDLVPATEKLARLHALQARQRAIQERRNQRWLGRDVEVLVEGPSKRHPGEWTGRTPEHHVVNFAGTTAEGRLETVTIRSATAFSLRAAPAAPVA
jgi:tRNA-2-methylthio-N6-dimethylallyladenosine synthase